MTTAKKTAAETAEGYEDLMALGRENAQALVESGTALAKGMRDLSALWLGLAQATMDESVGVAKAVLECKSVPEVLSVQTRAAKRNYERFVGESRKFSDVSLKVAEDTVAPIAGRVNATVEQLIRPFVSR